MNRILLVLELFAAALCQALRPPDILRRLDAPSTSDFSKRAHCGLAVLGDYLYIDGGELSLIKNANPALPSFAENSTLSISLATSWTNATVTFTSIGKPAPITNSEAVWTFPSFQGFYIWGGATAYGAPVSPPDKLWRFVANGSGGGSWAAETRKAATGHGTVYRGTSHAATAGRDAGYSLGGYANSWSDSPDNPAAEFDAYTQQPQPGLVVFNYTTKEWRNESTVGFTQPWGTYAGGVLEFVEGFGSGGGGLLVPLGGYTPLLKPGDRESSVGFLDFANVSLYDVETRQWHWQAATGDVPTSRKWLCSVAVHESGSKGYEIYIFGGYNDQSEDTFDDVHVLSLPGFRWFRAIYSPRAPRASHACAVVKNRQMISVGGADQAARDAWHDRDPWLNGIGVFDLTEMIWRSSFDPGAAPYIRPNVVSDWYAKGGSASWSSPEVKNLFTNFTESPSPGSNSPIAGPSGSPESSAPRIGAIVGGVVGGVVCVVLAVLLTVFFMRRRRQSSSGRSPVGIDRKMKMAGAELDTNVLSELETNYNRAELGTKPHGVLDMTEVPTKEARYELYAPVQNSPG